MEFSSSQSYFWFGCIPLRSVLAVLPVYLEEQYLELYSYLLFAIGLSFLFLYVTNSRMNAVESSTGKTWWAEYRLIHAMLYLTAGFYAYQKKVNITPLVIDVLLGIFLYFWKK